MTTANILQWEQTPFAARARVIDSTVAQVHMVILTEETEAPNVLEQNVLTPELIAQRMAIGTSADRSQFRPWAEVRDALLARNP